MKKLLFGFLALTTVIGLSTCDLLNTRMTIWNATSPPIYIDINLDGTTWKSNLTPYNSPSPAVDGYVSTGDHTLSATVHGGSVSSNLVVFTMNSGEDFEVSVSGDSSILTATGTAH
jgi:hypothetical protein